jgi:homoserine O-acetyltransferase
MVAHQVYNYNDEYPLECGASLPAFQLYYSTLGTLNADKSNVIWVCHAFSGSSDFTDWWPGLFGTGCLYDPSEYFIICANMPGSCYGSTGPLSINPRTQSQYFHDFPMLTNKDMVQAYNSLRRHLGIARIHTVIGCSMGGQQAIEWAVDQPGVFEHLIAIGANARHSPWAVAFNETQRMAILADPSWQESHEQAGLNGMKAARAVGLLSYRNYVCYELKQAEETEEKFDNFKSASYQQYQGQKLTHRFNAFTYWTLSKAMDSQNVGRGRGGLVAALSGIKAKSLFLGIDNDILFPTTEQKFLAEHVPHGIYDELDSIYGHDGFLIEFEKLSRTIDNFYRRAREIRRTA